MICRGYSLSKFQKIKNIIKNIFSHLKNNKNIKKMAAHNRYVNESQTSIWLIKRSRSVSKCAKSTCMDVLCLFSSINYMSHRLQ